MVPLLELNLLFFFSLFLHGISDLYSNILAKVFSCPEKTETLKLSLRIFIFEDFSIWVLLLDRLVTGIDPDLSDFSTMSFLFIFR